MKKIYLEAVLTIALLLVMSSFVIAIPKKVSSYDPGAKNSGPAGKSDVEHLYLVEKNPSWEIVPDGAWGKMTFDTDSFVFNGHELEAGEDYTLVNWDEASQNFGVELGEATADEGGNVHIMGEMPELSEFEYDYGTGSKVWLVKSGDIGSEGNLVEWNPTEYLFEYNLI